MRDVSPALAEFASRVRTYSHDLDEGTVLGYVMRHRRTFMLLRCIDPNHPFECWKSCISHPTWGNWSSSHTSDYVDTYENPRLQTMAAAAIAAIEEEQIHD